MQRRDNTARMAKALWSPESNELSASEFQAQFDAIYSAAEGLATLWQLGGAANDYLRLHPDSIVVPEELAPKLVASSMVDARIIGLKLLVRCSWDIRLIGSSICKALESKHEHELYGGLCELHNSLRRFDSVASMPVDDLLAGLGRLSSSRDAYERQSAARLADWIEELRGAKLR